jgi:hypothetical protein
MDVRACRFVDAHHLDQLRVEESDFAYTPTGWQWTTRQTIAEEHHWRADQRAGGHDALAIAHAADDEADGDRGWYRRPHRPPAWFEVGPSTAAQIATLYRDLRKGREDNKDEPGAADFYYGEMEMRRHAKREQIRLERGRGHRGTATTAATEYASCGSIGWSPATGCALGGPWRRWPPSCCSRAASLRSGAFAEPDQPSIRPVDVTAEGVPIYERQAVERPAGLDELPTAIRFSAQSVTALLRGPEVPSLSAVGEWLHIALRLLGPVLLGLAVLSVRGRVKR